MLFALSPKVAVIKQGHKTVCYNEITSALRTRPYLIGFTNVTLARNVQYNLPADPNIRLLRRDFIDVTQEVANGLDELNVPRPDATSIIIDPRAQLYIPKNQNPVSSHPLHDPGYHLDEIPYEDFMMYPFDKNIGIIMPYEIETEDDNMFTLRANVIEATESINAFRKSLPKL